MMNMLFIATEAIQDNLHRIMEASKEKDQFLNILWHEMQQTNSFVRYKNTLDPVWLDSYVRVLIIVKFHQFLIEDHNVQWKTFMRTKQISNDTLARTQRITTFIEKMSEQCNWHIKYKKGHLDIIKVHEYRPYLLPIVS